MSNPFDRQKEVIDVFETDPEYFENEIQRFNDTTAQTALFT